MLNIHILLPLISCASIYLVKEEEKERIDSPNHQSQRVRSEPRCSPSGNYPLQPQSLTDRRSNHAYI